MNCTSIEVSHDQIHAFVNDLHKELIQHKANKTCSHVSPKFTTKQVFFGGSTEYDNTYWEDICLFTIGQSELILTIQFDRVKIILKCLFHGEANSMISVKDLIKEYNSRKGLCSNCEYNNTEGCRCYKCKNGNLFVDVILLKDYVGDRIAEETAKEFLESEGGITLKTIMEVRERNYKNFIDHVNSQKEKLDNSLQIYREAYNAAKSDFENTMKTCMAIQVYKALEELDGEQA